MQLPVDFVPIPSDGEVESFERLPVAEIMRLVSDTEDYKPNCNLVIIDFLIRQGLITPETPGYCRLVASLRA
jgi:hypothetical protein